MKDERKIIEELKAGNVQIDKIKRSGQTTIHLYARVFFHEDIKQIERIVTKYGANWYVDFEKSYISIHR